MAKKNNASQPAELQIKICSLYNESLQRYPQLIDKLNKFIDIKKQNPIARVGSKDGPFHPSGHLGKLKIWHSHLSQNESILYRISGRHIYLFGIFDHADTGTSNTSSIPQQKSLALKLSHQYPELAEYIEDLAKLLESKLQ